MTLRFFKIYREDSLEKCQIGEEEVYFTSGVVMGPELLNPFARQSLKDRSELIKVKNEGILPAQEKRL